MAYPIPDAALAHHTVLLGKTRAGKSSAMRTMVERLLDQARPVCIIDPKGDWWGLKSSADGQRPGYKVVIFGGDHAEVPINAHSGAHVAELVATGNRPCIIDLGGWMVGERTRFFIDFASTFFRLTRGPRHLAIDEVHNFAPQGKVHDPDAGKMVHWANRLASEGAGKGITLLSASQRPQKVHKDYLTSHETLIAMRVIHKLDRDAIADWIRGAPDQELGQQVMATLASMERGEGWVWSPEAKFGPARIKFPMFTTYDSFAAPIQETVEKLKGWASVDLDEVREKLAGVVEQAKANDPRTLKAELARVQRELVQAQRGQAPAWPDQREEVATLQAELAESTAALERLTASAKELQLRQERALAALGGGAIEIPTAAPARPKIAHRPRPPVIEHKPRQAPPPVLNGAADGITGPQQRILGAIAWWNAFGIDQPTHEQVAFVAGYSPTSSGYRNLKSSLRTLALIDYPTPSRISLLPAGGAIAEVPSFDRSREAFHAQVQVKLTNPQWRVLAPLIQAYPDQLTHDDLAAASGYEPTSSGFRNLKSSLKTLGLTDYPAPGEVRAEDWLFP